jgi:hypothetical protein
MPRRLRPDDRHLYAVWQDGQFRCDGQADVVLTGSTDGPTVRAVWCRPSRLPKGATLGRHQTTWRDDPALGGF